MCKGQEGCGCHGGLEDEDDCGCQAQCEGPLTECGDHHDHQMGLDPSQMTADEEVKTLEELKEALEKRLETVNKRLGTLKSA
jgi:hypothetical protein